MDLLKKLIEAIKEIIEQFKKEKPPVEPPDDGEAPEAPEPTPEPAPELPKPGVPGKIDPTKDPQVTNPSAGVTSFLWKPLSDTNPKVAVITVSADEIRSDDLRVEIFDKDGTKIPLDEKKNKYSVGRGNQLPTHKYGRINFKPGMKAEEFKRLAPLTVRFSVILNGKRIPVSVMRKTEMKIKDPTKRLDLK